jgi:hypothetical protein
MHCEIGSEYRGNDNVDAITASEVSLSFDGLVTHYIVWLQVAVTERVVVTRLLEMNQEL